MQFTCDGRDLDIMIDHLYVAGWTGRDAAAVQHHIDELAELGVAPPSQVPLFYRTSNSLLSQSDLVEIVGDTSSGEVEPLIVRHDGTLYLGLASDHTDRELEAYSVAASKQACVKPVAAELWAYEGVENHLDELVLTCEIYENGGWKLYQQGTLSAIRPLETLLAKAALPEAAAMLCGTLGAIGGVRPAEQYRMSLEDPVLGRKISFEYATRSLPVVA